MAVNMEDITQTEEIFKSCYRTRNMAQLNVNGKKEKVLTDFWLANKQHKARVTIL